MQPATRGIIVLITGGGHDEDLDAIVNAIKQRRKVLNAQSAALLTPGAIVRFNHHADDWEGLQARAVRQAGQTWLVELLLDRDKRVGRRVLKPGARWRVPPSWLEVVIDDAELISL